MKITKNCVVTLKYCVKDFDGNIVDEGSEPISYLHGGYEDIFKKIEDILDNQEIGFKTEVKLNPDEAFGEYDESLITVESMDGFPEDLKVGAMFNGQNGKTGEDLLYVVTDIADNKVVLDANHPFAGLAIVFECEVTDIREATQEEIKAEHALLSEK